MPDSQQGASGRLLPPAESIYTGGGDFARIGEAWVDYLIHQCGLHPDDSVLDVGCGIGRVAIALTEYLSPRATYEGFDIVPSGVRWCSENITPRYPHFRFRLADIHNSEYNPGGTLDASEFQFPYPADTFHVAVLTSVFTHMLPEAVDHYVSEIARVLKPGGRCLASMFLLNEESLAWLGKGLERPRFDHDCGDYRVRLPEKPEAVVAYQEQYVHDVFSRHGFTLRRRDYGSWAGPNRSSTNKDWQDVVVADYRSHSART